MENKVRQHRILIIDDSTEDRQTYRRLIARNREEDFLFWEADSGEEGLRLYRLEHPDCVLLDYNLPDFNGLEFLARLDPDRPDHSAPIIMLTGQGTERVAVQALKMGAQDYLIKNRAAESIKYVVHSVIEKAELAQTIEAQRREQERVAQSLRDSEERFRLWGIRELRESEERYRLLVENVLDYAIIMLDATGHVVLWNTGAQHLYGYRAEEIIGRSSSCFYLPEDAVVECDQHGLKVAVAQGHFVDDGWRVRNDSTRFFAHVSVTPLHNEFGDLRGFAMVTHAIPEPKPQVSHEDHR